MASLYQQLPAVDRLLGHEAAAPALAEFGASAVTAMLRRLLAELRQRIRDGQLEALPSAESLLSQAEARLAQTRETSLCPVFNLTGTLLHTNLGRASLPEAALDAVSRIAVQPSNLEYDLAAGARGQRDSHVEALLCRLTGAEAATVVNNNAAAVLLCLNTLAKGRSVCVSRGELVEIGGSFRMPEIMASAGVRLQEVGATNRTHLRDYAKACDAGAAALMKIHTSNYEIKGFTASVSYRQLAELAAERSLPFLVDLGSGTLVDLADYGLAPEPTVMQVLEAGAALVTFSGDKLLGGPQAGVIVGRRDLVDAVNQNPLKRALRVDKMTLAALAALLRLYLKPETLAQAVPTLGLLARPLTEITALAQRLLPLVQERLGAIASAEVADCQSQVGSGALPTSALASKALALRPLDGKEASLQALVAAFKRLPVPVLGRLEAGRLLLDCRTVTDPRAFIANLDSLAPP